MAVVLGLVAYLMGPPESNPVNRNLDQAITAPAPATPPATGGMEAPGGDIAHTRPPIHVRLEFEEGEFEVVEAAVGEPIHIDAAYDEGTYDLVTAYEEDPQNGDRFTVKFKPRGALHGLRQLVHFRGQQKIENRITIHLPGDVPIDLAIRMRKGEARFDLGGLDLVGLDLDHAMGESEVRFDTPNGTRMEHLHVRARMGELVMEGLGNAAPRDVDFEGKMGEFNFDFSGEGPPPERASFSVMMGDAVVDVPRDVPVLMEGGFVFLGELDDSGVKDHVADPESPHRNGGPLRLKARVRLGSMTID